MPITLYRYILKELLRQLVLATGALVVVLSVGYSVVPMSQGSLSALSLLKLFFYLIPGMLSLALPIAAAYGATMVYFRMTSDNEMTACAAGGISYRTLLGPVVILGVVLTAGMFFLSNYIIPTFWQRVEQLAQRDLVEVAVRQLNQGREIPLGRNAICYADYAKIDHDPPIGAAREGDLTPYQRIEMSNVTVVRRDRRTGELGADFSSRSAVIDLYRYSGRTYAMMKLVNAMIYNPGTAEGDKTVRVWTEDQSLGPYEMPMPFEQKPQFMSLDQLRQVVKEPDRNKHVRDDADVLRMMLANTDTIDFLVERLTRGTPDQNPGLELTGHRSSRYTLTAPKITGRNTETLGLSGDEHNPVHLTETVTVEDRGVTRTEVRWYTAGSATIELNRDEPNDEPRISIELHDATVGSSHLPSPNQLETAKFPMLSLRQRIGGVHRFSRALDLLSASEDTGDPQIIKARKNLQSRINRLWRDIEAAAHERAAMAVNTMLIMLMGAMLSMKLRNKVPLVIFFWCFLPAIVAMVAIASGKNVLASQDISTLGGKAAIWAGVVLLIALSGGVYNALKRN